MAEIALLSQDTIDKIAAGEVVERPSSVVKELVENAIDAGSTAITVEIKEGGLSFIRITDNGCGIHKDQIPLAFLRHSTSKIRTVQDLLSVHSLGFRGEALSSISAVARVELITKTPEALNGVRYVIEGSKELSMEEIGAPDGTTFLVRDLFYNTPARRKFLKSAQTEGNYITDMIEKLAISHPHISFKYIQNNQTKLHTSGNGKIKDVIYHIYGRDITGNLLEIKKSCEHFEVEGFIGKPSVTRGNRSYENVFINGRYIKSALLNKAIEDGYKAFIMQHQYPFAVLHFTFPGDKLDVNVHPTKMEIRFESAQEIYQELFQVIQDSLYGRDLIQEVSVTKEKKVTYKPVISEPAPEPFEARRINDIRKAVAKDSPYHREYPDHTKPLPSVKVAEGTNQFDKTDTKKNVPVSSQLTKETPVIPQVSHYREMTLGDLDPVFLSKENKEKHHIIGQLFQTYWLVEMEDKLFVIDQHAAHEKVLYERMMKRLHTREFTSQQLQPPIVLTLDAREAEMLEKYRKEIETFGYEVEGFGGKEYLITAVPDNLFQLDMKDLFLEMLDDFGANLSKNTPELILEKVATMSCKAAVKGNHQLSLNEVKALIDELLGLENPYNCPHGRPTIISMTKSEIEKKFKRIVS